MPDSPRLDLPPQPRKRRTRPPKRPGNTVAHMAAVMRRTDIRQYFLGLTRENVNFREQLKYLIDSRQIFKPEYAWLCKQVMQYAFGVPAPLEEDLHDMAKSLIFLSQNPIGRPEFDPLTHAKPVGPALTAATQPQDEPAGPFVDLAGREMDPVEAPTEPFRMPERGPDYR